MSEPLKELPAALAAFQAAHAGAGKDSSGNFGSYTSLIGALQAAQKATQDGIGLSHTQSFKYEITEAGDVVTILVTTLLHSSGESITSELPLPLNGIQARNPAQALGSCITYARRYAVLAIYGLAGDDDDGEGCTPEPAVVASSVPPREREQKPKPMPRKAATPTKKAAPAAEPPEAELKKITQPIDQNLKDGLVNEIGGLDEDLRNRVLSSFQEAAGLMEVAELGPDHIKTARHGEILRGLIDEAQGVLA